MTVGGFWGRLRKGRDRGSVEIGVAFGGVLLVVGALAGNGAAATVVDMSDGQAWLPGEDGSIVQVNPATGVAERRLIVTDDGTELSIAQHDGELIVTDETSGLITAVDLTALVASGSRVANGDERVVIGGGMVALIDTDPGTVRAVDPLTLADLGAPYRTDSPIADAAVDGEGDVWVLTEKGVLTQLEYSAKAGTFRTGEDRKVAGAGSESRLVAHELGVTVFASDGGAVVQVGSGTEMAVTVPDLTGSVAAALRSPATLVPASVTDAGLVFLLSRGDLLQVDVGGLGCERPGGPQVFSGRVYVPCLGMGRVMVLDANGKRAGADIVVPGGGDAKFTDDEGRLFVTTPKDDRAVVVQTDGSTGLIDLDGEDVPEVKVSPVPPVTIPTPPRTETKNTQPDRPTTTNPVTTPNQNNGSAPTPGPSATPGSGAGSTPGGGSSADRVRNLRAQPSGDMVDITWTAPSPRPESYAVAVSDGGSSTEAGDATSAQLALPCNDGQVTITVTARHANGTDATATTTAAGRDCPQAQTATAATGVSATASGNAVTVRWTAASSGADEYLVRPAGGSWTSAGTATSLTLSGVAPGSYTFVVQTQLAGTTADSAPSAAVVIVGAPGAPGTPAVTVTHNAPSAYSFRADWAASAANGSPVTYTVSWSGSGIAGGSTTTTNAYLDGSGVCAQTSCAGWNGGVTVTVTPNNATGTGPAASGSGTGTVLPPPRNGDGAATITFADPDRFDRDIPYSVDVNLPQSWRAAGGTCTLYVTSSYGTTPRTFNCASGISGAGGGTRSLTTVSAYVTNGSVTSATATEQARNRNEWLYCEMPSGPCTLPVSLKSGDPSIQIVPGPWRPVISDDAVMSAGVLMLGLAGLSRVLRGRRSDGDQPAHSSDRPSEGASS